jgi:DNA repair protein RecN (Recombination protein N)
MLEVLHLKNVVLVNDVSIDFSSGFNVITGETGAGKSLIIKSLELLAGGVGSESIIRPNETMAVIEATFNIPQNLPIDSSFLDANRLTVSRRFYRDRPSVNKINYESVPVKTLKSVMRHVMFLTAQHQVLGLMNTANHLAMFDQFIGPNMHALNAQYQLEFKQYQQLKKEADDLLTAQDARSLQISELNEMVADITEKEFGMTEEGDLMDQQKKCDELTERQALASVIFEQSSRAIDGLNHIESSLEKLNKLTDDGFNYDVASLTESLTQLNQAMASEKLEIEYLESIDPDEIQSRLHLIFQYKVKYKVDSISELMSLSNNAKEKSAALQAHQIKSDEISSKLSEQRKIVVQLALELQQLRRSHKAGFEYCVLNQIKQLGMVDAKFSVSFSKLNELGQWGQDDILFEFSANPQSPLLPLGKAASGGELSRIMLALLVSSNGVLSQPLVVFDEIDVGVGGITANYIGNTLQKMAQNVQLIVVTHLPQIARCAAHHFTITKTVKNNQATVALKKLDKSDVSLELSRMVGGDLVASLIR